MNLYDYHSTPTDLKYYNGSIEDEIPALAWKKYSAMVNYLNIKQYLLKMRSILMNMLKHSTQDLKKVKLP